MRRPWLDWEALGRILDGERGSNILAASGGELRVLRLAHSLVAGELGATIPSLDRDAMALVLAALAHANGSHEHSGPATQDSAGRVEKFNRRYGKREYQDQLRAVAVGEDELSAMAILPTGKRPGWSVVSWSAVGLPPDSQTVAENLRCQGPVGGLSCDTEG